MKRGISINFGNLLLSLSDAIDFSNHAIAKHQQRVAFIAWEIGLQLKLPHPTLKRLFASSLLHDIGAFSLEEKIALHEFEDVNVETHCILGEVILKNSPIFKDLAPLIRNHHKEWEEWNENIDNPIVIESQIILLADYIERLIKRDLNILVQSFDISNKIVELSNKMFHPILVDAFISASKREEFWLDLVSPRLFSLLLNFGPYEKYEVETDDIIEISKIFRNIIDFKSHFTATHSAGVSACAVELAKRFGFSSIDLILMEVAGNLHDIGKLVIPNSILEKPGKLTKEEFAVIKMHTYYTYHIINTIGGLQTIMEWSAYHHEKLSGDGYPFHCNESNLSTGSKIMAVADIFTAITEDRPYRKGMDARKVMNIFTNLIKNKHVDDKIVAILYNNYSDINSRVKEVQKESKSFYESYCSMDYK